MKKWIPAVLLIALVAVSLETNQSFGQTQDALLLEDGFEKGTSKPNGWRKGNSVPGVKYVYQKKSAKSGKRCLGFEKSADRYWPFAQWSRNIKKQKDMKPGLKVVAQVKAEEAMKAIIEIQFLDRNGDQFSKEWAVYIGSGGDGDPAADHDWKEYANEFEIPAGTDRMRVALQMWGPGKVWFDDLQISFIDEVADAPEEETEAAVPLENQVDIEIGKHVGQYLNLPALGDVPESGAGLLIVIPGGGGGADFHPFVKNIQAHGLGDDFAVAQPIAKEWRPGQMNRIVWPTENSEVDGMGYSTEELVEAVVADVSSKSKIDPKRVFVLAWSSGGPAAYACLLKKDSPLKGGLMAMSVFFEKQLPPLENGKGKGIYIYHSPEDKICKYWIAKKAYELLSDAGVKTKMVDYEGGHGWHGNMYDDINAGMKWLDTSRDLSVEESERMLEDATSDAAAKLAAAREQLARAQADAEAEVRAAEQRLLEAKKKSGNK